MKRTLRIALVLSFACATIASLSNVAHAQRIDIAFGVSTILAPGANSNSGNNDHAPVSLGGGAYPGVSGDVLFWHNLGVGAEVFWRGSQSDNYYASFFGPGLGFRPVFYNFNAVYSPKIVDHVYLELVGGVGALDTHFYACNLCTGSGGGGSTLISSSNHFDADFGGGLKIYPGHGFFIRPEARFYVINNDTDYSSNHAARVGVSIGYTFR